MSTCSITIPEMAQLVSSTESALEHIPMDVSRLSSGLNGVMLSSTEPHRADAVIAWLDGELPGLRRRLALARVIEASEPGIQTQVSIDESAISTASPDEAVERAERLAELMRDYDDGDIPDELLELLLANMADPYFATALYNAVSPQDMADVVLAMSSQRQSIMTSSALSSYQQELVDAYDDDYEAFLDALGTTLGVASFNTGDLAIDGFAPVDMVDAMGRGAPGERQRAVADHLQGHLLGQLHQPDGELLHRLREGVCRAGLLVQPQPHRLR